MYEDIVTNSAFCLQIGRLLTFVHNGTFAIQLLSEKQKSEFAKAVRSTVDPNYE